MSNVPTNLIPSTITQLPEYSGSSTLGYFPYSLNGRTYKVQFSNLAAVGAVPSSRVIAAGTGLAGGGDLSENRVISIANGGVGFDQLSATGVSAGSYGSGGDVPVITVDAKGRVTDISTTPLVVTGYVPDSRTITTGAGLLGGGSLASNRTLSVDFYASAPQALGSASPGVSNAAARGDHVHPAVNLSDTTQTQGALPLGRGGTGDALSPVAGAVVYSTGTKFALADPGDPGQVLTSAGSGEPYWSTIAGTGTVTSVSVLTANGFSGTVAFANTTPQITISTTVTGMVKGDGVSLSEATPGVDYVAPSAYISSGLTMATDRLLGRTDLGTGAAQEITVGTGLTLASGSLVNSAPDQVVSLTGAGTTTVTGTYPNFTITSNDAYTGTVTSVAASGGSTGLTFSGSPITTSGTLTLGGTLAVASGGTGATTASGARTNLGAAASGANSDITSLSGITGAIGTPTYIQFDSGAGTTLAAGRLWYDQITGSLNMGMGGGNITQQIGEELFVYGKASAAITEGQVVVKTGAVGASGTITFAPAPLNTADSQAIIGVATENISLNGFGRITAFGVVHGINTTGSAYGETWADGDTLYYNPNYVGGLTNVKPSAPNQKTEVGIVINAGSGGSGSIQVEIIHGTSLGGTDNNVQITSPANNDLLQYSSSLGYWRNVSNTSISVGSATTATNLAGGAGGSIPYQSIAGTTTFLASGTGVLTASGGNPSYTMSPSLTQVTVAADPTTNLQVATKQYVDTLVASGITYHTPVKYEVPDTTGNLNATYNNGTAGVGATLTNAGTLAAFTPDGTVAQVGDRILVYNQTNAYENGVYTVTTVGSGSVAWVLTRATDANSYALKSPTGLGEGDAFFVTSGATGAGETYVCNTTGTITFGTTPITFVQVSSAPVYTAGTGLTLTGNQFSLTSPVATSLGGTGLTSFTSGGAVYATSTSALTTGTLPLTAGGTGATTAVGARTSLGGTTVGSNFFTLTNPNAITFPQINADNTVSALSAAAFRAAIGAGTGSGSVTSVDVSGGTTGLTTSGGPITSSGTITLAGTLNVANGGTGATSLSSGYLVKGNGTSAVSASVVYDDGTNVGIGTSSPANKLDVNGTAGATAYLLNSSSHLIYSGSSTEIAFRIGASGPYYGIGTTGSNNMRINSASGGDMLFSVSGNEYMRINYLGNIGIGTSSPAQKLDVNGVIKGGVASGVTLAMADNSAIRQSGTSGGTMYFDTATGGATHGAFEFRSSNAYTSRMYIDSSGNVGIGTSSPGARLDVRAANIADGTNGGIVNVYSTTTQAANVGGKLDLGGLYDGSNSLSFASVAGRKENSTSGDWSGYMQFSTRRFGGDFAERMRIDSSGNLLLNTTTAVQPLTIGSGSATSAGINLRTTQTDFSVVASNSAAGGVTIGTSWVSGGQGPLIFTQAAGERMRIDSSGNLGIGTSSPAYKLDVSGVINTNAALRMTPTNVGAFTRAQLQSAYNLDGTAASVFTWNYTSGGGELDLFINRDGGGVGGLKIYDFPNTSGNPTNILTVEGGGNVGIGTSSPGYKLDVNGTGSFVGSSGVGAIRVAGAGGSWFWIDNPTGTTMRFSSGATAGTNPMVLGSDGSMQLSVGGVSNTHQFLYNESGGEIQLVDSTGAGPILIDNSGGLARFYKVGSGAISMGTTGANYFQFITNGSERMRIDVNGLVGIGTSNPQNRLHVNSGASNEVARFETTGTAPYVPFYGNGSRTGFIQFGSASANIWYDAAGPMVFWTNGTEQFRILVTGGITSASLADAVGYKGLPQNQQTSGYTLALSDMGKHIYATAANFNITIPANATVAFPIGTAITIVVEDQFHTLVPASGVTLVLAGTGAATTGTRTLAQGSVATIIKVGTNRWYVSGSGVT